MPSVERFSNPPQLRRCIIDLLALSTLPAIWHDYDARQIVDSVAAALLSMLDAEFVHACLAGSRGEPAIEITRTGPALPAGSPELIDKVARAWRERRASEMTTIPHPLGEGRLRIVSAPVGFGRDAVLVAASRRRDFPTELQQLLLRVAANEAAIALHRRHAEEDERRFAELVESSSDFLGFASLEGAPLYINAAGLQLVGLTRLEDADGLHVLEFLMPQEREQASRQYWPRVFRDGCWSGEIECRHFQTGVAIPFLVVAHRSSAHRTSHEHRHDRPRPEGAEAFGVGVVLSQRDT
jgi:PAS domain S-box-containing protein